MKIVYYGITLLALAYLAWLVTRGVWAFYTDRCSRCRRKLFRFTFDHKYIGDWHSVICKDCFWDDYSQHEGKIQKAQMKDSQ